LHHPQSEFEQVHHLTNTNELMHYQLYTNTPLSNKRQYFTVTEENHPLYGNRYGINNFSKSFGVTLIQYTDDDCLEKSINVAFTSLNIINPFVLINKGRCDFLFTDLLVLSEELLRISERIKC